MNFNIFGGYIWNKVLLIFFPRSNIPEEQSPQKSKKKIKFKDMARQLAAEKARTKLLWKRLQQSKKENKLLVDRFNKHSVTDGSSTDGSTTIGFNEGSRFSSTRNPVETVQDENQEDPRIINAQDTSGTTHEESRFLSSDDEARISNARNTTNANQKNSQTCFTRNGSQEESRFLSSMNQLSVASINVPECKPTDDGDVHRQTFEVWKDLLVDSMNLAGIDDEHTMFTVFKVKAGIKLLQIFRNTKSQNDDPDPQTRPFSNAMHRLKSYFGSGSDIMLMRRKLALMAQRADETDLAFITRVGSTAQLCGYDDGKEFEEIVATIAEHARDKEMRITALRMLSKKGCFTDLIDQVRELESIKLNKEYVMRRHGKLNQASVAAVTTPYQRQQRFPERYQSRNKPYQRSEQKPRTGWRPPRDTNLNSNNTEQSKTKCWRCDSVFHSEDECFAKGKVCNNCGDLGHIRRACPSRFERGREQRMVRIREEPPQQIAIVGKSEGDATENGKVSEIIET